MKYSSFIKRVLSVYRQYPETYLCALVYRVGKSLGESEHAATLELQIVIEVAKAVAKKPGGEVDPFELSTIYDIFGHNNIYYGPNEPLYGICVAFHGNPIRAARITMLLHLYKAALKQELHHGA